MILDLKTLMLLSSQKTKNKEFRKRIYVANKCFIIEYELKSKYLHIKNIKSVSKPKNPLLKRTFFNKTPTRKPKIKNVETQTKNLNAEAKYITNKNMDLSFYQQKEKMTQTPCSYSINKYCGVRLFEQCYSSKAHNDQLEERMEPIAELRKNVNDCKKLTTRNSQTQTDNVTHLKDKQFQYFINNIENLLANQKQLLNNNSNMLTHVSEIFQLLSAQDDELNDTQKAEISKINPVTKKKSNDQQNAYKNIDLHKELRKVTYNELPTIANQTETVKKNYNKKKKGLS